MSITRVAKLARVSTSTVSRVINNHPRVAPKTAKVVRRAMEAIGYQCSPRRPGPKPASRPGGGSATVGFIVLGRSQGRTTPAFEELLRGVSTTCADRDVSLIFHHLVNADTLPQWIMEHRVDGLLLHGAAPMAELKQQLSRQPTVWLMGNRTRPTWGDQVLPDGCAVGELAAEHFVRRGHRRLAFLNLDAGHWSLRLYGHAFATAGTDIGAQVTRVEHRHDDSANGPWRDHSDESIADVAQRFVALSPRPTGVFVADDHQVAVLQPALQKAGVDIGPGAVEIISCNNESPYLMGLSPRPTEIDIRVESIGRRGVEQLAWRMQHRDVPERIITTVEPMIVNDPASTPAPSPKPATSPSIAAAAAADPFTGSWIS